MRVPTSSYGPGVAADLTAVVCLGVAVAKRSTSDCTKTAARAPSRRDFGQQKRLARASQALRTALGGSRLRNIRVPTQLIRVPRG